MYQAVQQVKMTVIRVQSFRLKYVFVLLLRLGIVIFIIIIVINSNINSSPLNILAVLDHHNRRSLVSRTNRNPGH